MGGNQNSPALQMSPVLRGRTSTVGSITAAGPDAPTAQQHVGFRWDLFGQLRIGDCNGVPRLVRYRHNRPIMLHDRRNQRLPADPISRRINPAEHRRQKFQDRGPGGRILATIPLTETCWGL